MIIRVFRALVHDGMQDEFENFFLNQAIPHVHSQPGLISLSVGRPMTHEHPEFVMTMLWDNLDSIKRFAGSTWQNAVILEDEKHLLKDVHVHHYEHVVDAAN